MGLQVCPGCIAVFEPDRNAIVCNGCIKAIRRNEWRPPAALNRMIQRHVTAIRRLSLALDPPGWLKRLVLAQTDGQPTSNQPTSGPASSEAD